MVQGLTVGIRIKVVSFRILWLISVVVNGLSFGTSNLFAQSSQSVTLAWDASPTPGVASYVLHYGNTSGNYLYSTNVGNQTTTRVAGLQSGLTYYFAVGARDGAGIESVPSNEVSYQVPISNPPPVIALTSPASGMSYAAPASLTCAASVATNGHAISKVQFYYGSTLIGEDTTAPFSLAWNNVPAGNYNLTARLVFDSTNSITSSVVTVAVTNVLPVVAMTAPANGAVYPAPAAISLAAIVTANGHTITEVQFYNGTTMLGGDTSAPYSLNWSNVSAGNYSLTARVIYDAGSAVVSSPVNVSAVNSPSGLWAGYGFEETSGSAALDVSANGFHGTLTGNPARTAAGRFGRALEFTGNGERVDLGNVDISGSALTISCWIRGDSFDNSDGRLVSKATGINEDEHYWMLSAISSEGAKPRFRLKTTSGATSTLIGTVNLETGVWTHVAATYDGAAMNLYVNGQPAGSMARTGTIAQSGSVPVAIGDQPQGGASFDGLIDEVRIHSVALTAAEIQAVMNAPAVSSGTPPPTIALTSPAAGASYTAPATINLTANVTPNGNAITKVQFFNGTTLIGEDTSSPYAYTWNNAGAASYNLKARVVYGAGGTLDSATVNVTVTNPPPTIALASPTNGATYASPALINCAASVAANGHTITKVQFFNGSTLIGEDTTAPYNYSWNGVSSGTYTVIARAVYDSGSTLDTTPVNVTVKGLPAPWQSVDIGTTGLEGGASHSNGTYTVSGAGKLGGTADAFQFVYQPLSADGEIKARLNSIGTDGGNRVVGLMIRESLAPNAKYAFMGVGNNLKYRWQRRSSTGGNTSSTTSGACAAPNAWLRVQRVSNTLYGYKSTDGTNWSKVSSPTITMATNIYVGLVVASGDTNTLNTSVFTTITVVP